MTLSLSRSALGLALALSVTAIAQAQELSTPQQKAGYSVGVNIGSNLRGQNVHEEIDVKAMLQGLQDSIGGAATKMKPEEMQAALEQLTTSMQAKQQAAVAAQEQAGKDFLVKNATAAGVKTTASGLQYSVVTASKDAKAAMPKATDTVKVHYHGTLTDGTVFDSSVERGEPIEFPLNGVIPGWTEGLQLMKVGDKFRLYIPSDLGYGPQGAGPIPPNAVLIFDVELLEIKAAAAAAANAPAQ
jgi:FKBP-type peptidyl-prolyl cis-trans isomerase FklB